MKRPKTIWLLMALFLGSFVRGVNVVLRQSDSDVFQLFAAAGIEAAFFVFVVASVMLDGATLRYLWKPEPTGLRVGLASLGVGAAFAVLSGLIAISHPDLVRALVVANQQARGGAIDPRALDLATSTAGLTASVAFTLVKVGLCAWLLVWNRAYFSSRE